MKKTDINLVPDTVNTTPDYYCTWQTQLYASCNGKPEGQRAIIDENSLFNKEKPYGWAYFYEKARRDLILVMDDSWDVPVNSDKEYFGSLVLNGEKFPEAVNNAENNTAALKNLTDRILSLGWKGLGGWICAQKAPKIGEKVTDEDYWRERLIAANDAGFSYWKVDWGGQCKSVDFRLMLTALGKKYAPNLTVEHAMIKEIIPKCDIFRTYDVPAIMSIPMTMEKLADILSVTPKAEGENKGLINCEDEVCIAAAGGFAMGVMRHPYSGDFMNGKKDMSFPAVHRNLKTKMYEVLRALRWHRIAPAFGADNENVQVSEKTLTDNWIFENMENELEDWWLVHPFTKDDIKDGGFTKSAPSAISRGCNLPEIEPDEKGDIPYCVAAKNPNGAFSLVTLGRTRGREYKIPECNVSVQTGNSKIIGVFGEYRNLTLKTELEGIDCIFIQDLAGDTAYDVSGQVEISGDKVIIPGELIKEIGTECQPNADTSEPGVVIRLENK